jgi:hypothetical protein
MTASFPNLKMEQLVKAIQALLKFVGQEKDGNTELFDEDELLYLVSRSPLCSLFRGVLLLLDWFRGLLVILERDTWVSSFLVRICVL